MKILIKKTASLDYIHRQSVHHQPVNWKWVETLKKIQGKELKVETKFLFKDQYNTEPIKGISDIGFRIMEEDVEKVIDDIRSSKMRCQWCGKTNDKATTCPDCGKSDYLENF